MSSSKLLVTQSFIVDDPGTYWDYRDYIFSFCSNISIKEQPFRLNIERGNKWLSEFVSAAKYYGFSDFEITEYKPDSWADYMIEQIEKNSTRWTMPFSGDHIYINENPELLLKFIEKAENFGADAIAYSHIQDWDYLLDWEIVEKTYEDDECVIINWGHKYKFYRNHKIVKKALKKIHQFIVIPPVPGYLIYNSIFLKKILSAIPFKTKRWQDMEYSPAKEAYSFRILIPKKCLYRHVHGYWLELYLKNKEKGLLNNELDRELKSMYLRTNFNWKTGKPSVEDYKITSLNKNLYFKKYFSNKGLALEGISENIFSTKRQNKTKIVTKLRKIVKKFIYGYFLVFLEKIKKKMKGIY